MDFNEILDAWEKKQTGTRSTDQQNMDDLISRYPPNEQKEEDQDRQNGETNPRQRETQAVLDLHGMSSREAEQALENFIHLARRRGHQKVLIVHGKGHHSKGEPVLRGVVHRYLEKCPYTGAFGPATAKQGGRGATWVSLRGA
jgi:DNA-nicking Smr family endonuclease